MKISKKVPSEIFTFNQVELREPLVGDLIIAEKMAEDRGAEFVLYLLSRIATFDGREVSPEELKKMRLKDFFLLAKSLEEIGLQELAKELLSSQEKEVSP